MKSKKTIRKRVENDEDAMTARAPSSKVALGVHLLVSALELPNQRFTTSALRSVLRVASSVPWLASEMTHLLEDARWLDAAKSIVDAAGGDSAIADQKTLVVQQAEFYNSLKDRYFRPAQDVEALRALLLLALVQLSRSSGRRRGSAEHPVPTRAFVEALASSIRRMTRDSRSPIFAFSSSLINVQSFEDFVRRFSNGLEILRRNNDGVTFAQEASKSLAWMRNLSSHLPPTTIEKEDEEEEDGDAAQSRLNRRRRTPTAALGFRSISVPRTSGLDQEESNAEDEAIFRLGAAIPTPGQPPASLRDRLNQARSLICRSNQNLKIDHISVSSDAELGAILPAIRLQRISEFAAKRVAPAGMGFIAELSVLSGRSSLDLAEILLGESHPKPATAFLSISLKAGTLRIPVIRPPEAFEPTAENRDLFARTIPHLDLALPASLIQDLQIYHRELGQTTIYSGLKSRTSQQPNDPDELTTDDSPTVREMNNQVQAYLQSFIDLPLPSLSVARIRQRFLAQICEHTQDIAAVMILSGDSLGNSLAPLYYYAPLARHLSELHRNHIWPMAGYEAVKLSSSEQRVGAQGLVLPEEIETRVGQLADTLSSRRTAKSMSQREWLSLRHNCMADYTMSFFQAGTSHRPNTALFEVRRWDVDLVRHAAVLQDKDVDAAHKVRLAASCPSVSEQLKLWLSHLAELLKHPKSPQALRQRIQLALSGEGALFFRVDDQLNQVDFGKFDAWKAAFPDFWKELRASWYRTAVSSAMRESGANPLLVETHLGHLDAAQRPFASDSALNPMEYCAALAPHLQAALTKQGWKVRSGIAPKPVDPYDLLPPLRDWSRDLESHEAECKKLQQALRQNLRLHSRSLRELVEPKLTKAFAEVLPELAKQLASSPQRKSKKIQSTPSGSVSTAQVRAIQEKLLKHFSNESAKKSIAENLLAMMLRRARRQLGWDVPELKIELPERGPEPTPFITGMMKATTHVQALRRHFLDDTHQYDGDRLYAKCFMMVGLFTPYIERTKIQNILRDAGSAVRMAPFQDLVALDLGSADCREGHFFHGLACLALGAAGQGLPVDMDDQRLQAAMVAVSPEWAAGCGGDFLVQFLSTLRINQVFEVSPIGRTALANSGSVAAPTEYQRAFLNNTMAYDRATSPAESKVTPPASSSVPFAGGHLSSDEKAKAKAKMAREYRQLMEILDTQKGVAVHFKRIDKKFKSGRGEKAREARIKEIQAFITQSKAPEGSVVRALAEYALDITSYGTQQRLEPAPATVSTYTSRLGSKLMELCPLVDLRELQADEFTELYESAIALTDGVNAVNQVAGQSLHLHKLLMKRLGVEDFDRAVVAAHISEDRNSIDARIITQKEYEAALEFLKHGLPEGMNHTALRRRDEICIANLILLKAAGLRTSEAFCLRHRDLVITGEHAVLMVKPTAYSWLKTVAARRLINIGRRLSIWERQWLQNWQQREVKRLGSAFKDALPLFEDLTRPGYPILVNDMRNRLLDVLRGVTGRNVRLHHLRHLWVHQGVTPLLFEGTDPILYKSLRSQRVMPITGNDEGSMLLPSSFRGLYLEAGHQHGRTTICSYHHQPWTFLGPNEAKDTQLYSRRAFASVSNRAAAANDQAIHRAGSNVDDRRAQLSTLIDRSFDIHYSSAYVEKSNIDPSDKIPEFGPYEFENLLRQTDPEGDPRISLLAAGLSESSVHKVIEAARELNELCRYRPFSLLVKGIEQKPTPRPRFIGSSNPFEPWLKARDEAGLFALKALSDVFVQGYRPSIRGGLMLFAQERDSLKRAVALLGENLVTSSTRLEDEARQVLSVSSSSTHLRHDHMLNWTLATAWIYLRVGPN